MTNLMIAHRAVFVALLCLVFVACDNATGVDCGTIGLSAICAVIIIE